MSIMVPSTELETVPSGSSVTTEDEREGATAVVCLPFSMLSWTRECVRTTHTHTQNLGGWVGEETIHTREKDNDHCASCGLILSSLLAVVKKLDGSGCCHEARQRERRPSRFQKSDDEWMTLVANSRFRRHWVQTRRLPGSRRNSDCHERHPWDRTSST